MQNLGIVAVALAVAGKIKRFYHRGQRDKKVVDQSKNFTKTGEKNAD